MTVINRLASALDRTDEAPNQLLAKEIVAAGDTQAVQELVENLTNTERDIQNDCIKVLYEVGAANPDLITAYVNDFIHALLSSNNRLVWGAMTALGAIADRRADEIYIQIGVILEATETGSVITQDWGIRVLAAVARKDTTYAERISPFLLKFLDHCPNKDLPRHAESCVIMVTRENRREFIMVLEGRCGSLKVTQANRVERVIQQMHAL